MTVLHSGSTGKYADNWAKAFGGGGAKKGAKKKKAASKRKAAAKKKTKATG